MSPKRMQRLLDFLPDVRTTDELLDLEQQLGPFDEEDAMAAHALFLMWAARCRLAAGPQPSAAAFSLVRPAPAWSRQRFEVRGRVGTRIVRVVWADGALFGSLHALRLAERGGRCPSDADVARRRIHAMFDEVHEEIGALACMSADAPATVVA